MASAKYQRRIERGLARGLTRSQARGHPRPGERLVRAKRLATDDKLEAALKALRINGNQAMAAKSAGVSVERFRRFLRENRIAERQGRRWRITDPRPRQVVIISIRGERQITVSGFDASSLVMLHRAAVQRFLVTNDASELQPFAGASVTDTRGRKHALETRPNHVYRLAQAGSEGFEQVYRLTT